MSTDAPVTQPSAADIATAPRRDWRLDTDNGSLRPRRRSTSWSTSTTRSPTGDVTEYQPVPLGFTPLDKTIGGGLRAGELLLIGGAQGTGKTTMALQMARNIARAARRTCSTSASSTTSSTCSTGSSRWSRRCPPAAQDRRHQDRGRPQGDPRDLDGRGRRRAPRLATNPRLRPALDRIARYGQNLFLLRGSQTASTVDNIRKLVQQHRQPVGRPPPRRLHRLHAEGARRSRSRQNETEKVTYVVNGLKDIALTEDVPMVSIVAADKEGLKASRLRNHHLRGSSAINYEADIILILNEKYQIVAKVNIEFNPYQAQRFRDWVVASVEKNRGGQDNVDLEFEKHFEFSCFDPNGRTVQEKLIEERLYND